LGLALVEAYTNMGLSLAKHYLRAAMEQDCQRIARNEVPKQTVVDRCLEEMRKIFLQATQQADKLDAAVAKHLANGPGAGAAGTGANQQDYQVVAPGFSRCGVCDSMMDLQVPYLSPI